MRIRKRRKAGQDCKDLLASLASVRGLIEENRSMLQKDEIEWKYTAYALMNDLVYSLNLFLAFCLTCSFFFEGPIPISGICSGSFLNLVGSILSLVLTITANGISGVIGTSKASELSLFVEQGCQRFLAEFIRTGCDEEERKRLYLEIKICMMNSARDAALARHKLWNTLFTSSMEATFPLIAMSLLVYAPLSAAITIIVLLILSALAVYVIRKRVQPEAQTLMEFDEQEFSAFQANVEADQQLIKAELKSAIAVKPNIQRCLGFFAGQPGPARQQEPEVPEDELESSFVSA